MKPLRILLIWALLLLTLAGCGTVTPASTLEDVTLPATVPVTEPPTGPTGPMEPAEPVPTELSTEPEPTEPATSPVLDILVQLYEPDGTVTPIDYERLSYLPLEGLNDLITWSVDVDPQQIAIVQNGNEAVTVDVNELCQEDMTYHLTASVVNADGIRVSHTWEYILPKARDMAEILDEAYNLPLRQQLSYYATLTGTITSIDKAWSEDYQNITLIMKVTSAGNRSVRCYSLVGEGTESLKIGDEITVTGILQRYGNIVEFDSGCKLQKPFSIPEDEN